MWLLAVLAVPEVGLTSVFLISFLSATLLPLGSEPTVFAVVKANPTLYWAVIIVATVGNTLGGVVDYWMGWQARQTLAPNANGRLLRWVNRLGPKILLFGWLPAVGDPLCTLAGWSRLPLWPSITYMAVGKCLRYIALIGVLQTVPDSWWQQVARWL